VVECSQKCILGQKNSISSRGRRFFAVGRTYNHLQYLFYTNIYIIYLFTTSVGQWLCDCENEHNTYQKCTYIQEYEKKRLLATRVFARYNKQEKRKRAIVYVLTNENNRYKIRITSCFKIINTNDPATAGPIMIILTLYI